MTGNPSVGLALSGGGARGLAHIGVLKVLEREEITPAFLAGTSMGGMLSAASAAGMSAADIEEETLRITSPRQMARLLDPQPLRRGLLAGDKVTGYLRELFGERTFADTICPLALVAVDLNNNSQVVFREGALVDAVRATVSVPGVFAPIDTGERLLVDGGVLNNLPNDVIRRMGAERVVAVDVHTPSHRGALTRMSQRRFVPSGPVDTLDHVWRSLRLMAEEIQRLRLELDPPDVFIRPELGHEITMLTGFGRASEIIDAGEEAAERALPQIRACMTADCPD